MQRYKLGKLGGKKLMAGRLGLSKIPGIMLPIVGLVVFVGILATFPVISVGRDEAHAEGGSSSSDGISISLDKDTLNLSSTNADTNGFVYDKVTASVTTSSSAGYNLYMSAAGKDKDDNYTASLVNANDKKYTIDTLADKTTLSLPYTEEEIDGGNTKRTYTNTTSFTTSTWAYSVVKESDAANTSVFYPIPLDTTMININSNDETISSAALSGLDPDEDRSSKIHSTENATGSAHDGTEPDNIDITLAARSDNTLPAGNYENNIVFTTISKALPGIEVTFNADGLYFNDDKNFTTNTVLYDYNTTCKEGAYKTLYSHTPNISDDGVQSGSYSNSASTNEVLSMPGVDKLHITLTYAGESASYDWVSIWQGNHPDYTAANNYSTGITLGDQGPKFGGGNGTTVEGYVEGDTVTIAFRSDGGGVGNGYGYYAVIDGYMTDSDGNELKNGICGNFPLTDGGEYISPTLNDATFLGWSTKKGSTGASDVIYKNGGQIIKDIGDSSTQKLTLYAVWGYNVNITTGSGIASGPTGAGVYRNDTKVQLNATWNTAGYHGLAWEVTSENATLSSTSVVNPTFTMPAADVNIKVAGVVNTYTVVYNGNGGTGTMNNTTFYGSSAKVKLNSNSFTRSNYKFLGWAFNSYDTSAKYTNSQNIDVDAILSDANATTAGDDTITLYAVWQAQVTYVYNVNGGTAISALSNKVVAAGSSVTLSAPNYSRSGYGFAGWNTEANGTGTNYGPEEIVTAPSTPQTVNLYARWIASAGNMQSWKGCSSLTTGMMTALKDTRDNNVYTVAKLADGKCWQTENLRLSSGTISSSTTHAPASGFSLGSSNTGTWCKDDNATCYDKSTWENSNSSKYYMYGNYYSWYTATAGNGRYATARSTTVSGDICPLGWHLPTSGSDSSEFSMMYSKAGSSVAVIKKYPYNFVFSGIRHTDQAYYSTGFYWSSTSSNISSYAYHLYLSSSEVDPLSDYYKYVGATVRCISS